jgi:hypothetical protein
MKLSGRALMIAALAATKLMGDTPAETIRESFRRYGVADCPELEAHVAACAAAGDSVLPLARRAGVEREVEEVVRELRRGRQQGDAAWRD